MDYFTLARVLHVLAVIFWIGGVAMVTTVIIPSVKRMKSKEERLETFERIEGRFALQAKVTTLITGLSGFYMIYYLDAWDRYLNPDFWWIHAMTLVWIIFTLILFVLEPYVLHRIFRNYALEKSGKAFSFLYMAHWILLILSIITIIGAVAGAHGWYFL